jgi:hypothetical protein
MPPAARHRQQPGSMAEFTAHEGSGLLFEPAMPPRWPPPQRSPLTRRVARAGCRRCAAS